jgi:hypothetical protein
MLFYFIAGMVRFVFLCGSYLISRALGPKLGGAVGCLYWLGVLMLSVLEVR